MVHDALARFAALVAEPDDALPLDEAMLIVAAQAHPDLDVARERARLDELAAGVDDPSLEGVVERLCVELGFTGDDDDYYAARNSLLPDVVERRRGIPISLGVVAMEVGRRCGVDVVGVGLPGHFLVRAGSRPHRHVDLFHGGRELDQDEVRRLFRQVTGGAPWDPAYLRPCGHRQILVRVLSNLAGAHRRAGDREGLCWALQLRHRLPGVTVTERRELGLLLGASGRFDEGAEVLERTGEARDREAAARLRARLN